MKPVAAFALLALATLPARAETIAKERFGCHSREVLERLFQLVSVNETEAFGHLLQSNVATGECRTWKPGQDVRTEVRTMGYVCISAADAAGQCYWTPVSAVGEAGAAPAKP